MYAVIRMTFHTFFWIGWGIGSLSNWWPGYPGYPAGYSPKMTWCSFRASLPGFPSTDHVRNLIEIKITLFI